MIHNFKELVVWEKGMELCGEIEEMVQKFPTTQSFTLGNQIRRASISVPSNIAEGAGYNSDRQFCKFLSISLGSAYEVETQLLLARRYGLVMEEDFLRVEGLVKKIQAMIFNFRKHLKEKPVPKEV